MDKAYAEMARDDRARPIQPMWPTLVDFPPNIYLVKNLLQLEILLRCLIALVSQTFYSEKHKKQLLDSRNLNRNPNLGSFLLYVPSFPFFYLPHTQDEI